MIFSSSLKMKPKSFFVTYIFIPKLAAHIIFCFQLVGTVFQTKVASDFGIFYSTTLNFFETLSQKVMISCACRII